MSTPQFTPAEIEKMRQLVGEHDKKTMVNSFDLNNPPHVPYRHQDWPRLLYKLHPEGHQAYLRVNDRDEHEAALEAGWSNTPVAAADPGQTELDEASAAEVAAVDAKIAANKKARKAAK